MFWLRVFRPNPSHFPALGFGIMQKNGKVYANTGIELTDQFMVLNPHAKTHANLQKYFNDLSQKGGFTDKDQIQTGNYFKTSWVRVG